MKQLKRILQAFSSGKSENNNPEGFDNSAEPKMIFDKDTLRFLAVNNAALLLYGYTKEEFLHLTITDIRPAFEVAKLERHLQEHKFYGPNTGTWKHLAKDGTLLWVEVQAKDVNFQGTNQRLVTIRNLNGDL